MVHHFLSKLHLVPHLRMDTKHLLQSINSLFQQSQDGNHPSKNQRIRSELIRSREFNGWRIDREIHVAQEAEAIRILGSMQGNDINIQAKWNEITERQTRTMKQWSLIYPSIAGHVLITKALVISLTYYLMTVNGISRNTLMAMEKRYPVLHLEWPERSDGMGQSYPTRIGRRHRCTKLRLRYEAIRVGWLNRWLRPEPDRPKWAWVTNDLLFQCAKQKPRVERPSVGEWICQSWQIKNRSETLPFSLRELINPAQKYNATISRMRASADQRLGMPAFYHPYVQNKTFKIIRKS